MPIFTRSRTAKTAYQYNLKDELVQAEDTDLTNGNTLLDRETWGLDAAGNWLSRSRTATSLMETRTNDALNRLMQIGGAGSTVVEGRVNEFASVTVAANGQGAQPAALSADPVAGGYRFARTVIEAANSGAMPATKKKVMPSKLLESEPYTRQVPDFAIHPNASTHGPPTSSAVPGQPQFPHQVSFNRRSRGIG